MRRLASKRWAASFFLCSSKNMYLTDQSKARDPVIMATDSRVPHPKKAALGKKLPVSSVSRAKATMLAAAVVVHLRLSTYALSASNDGSLFVDCIDFVCIGLDGGWGAPLVDVLQQLFYDG